MTSEKTSVKQGRVSNCDGSCSADITVLFSSEVIKYSATIFVNQLDS